MDDKTVCPLCGEGHVTPRTEEMVTEYSGQKGTVTLHYVECDVCGSEITDDADGRANKRAVLAFRKSVGGLLTGAEIRALREQYGITQDQSARLFGGGPKAFSKYESDDVAHSVSMDTLLRLVRNNEEAFLDLVAQKGMTAELPSRPHRPTVQPHDTRFVLVLAGAEVAQPVVQRRAVTYPAPHRDYQASLH